MTQPSETDELRAGPMRRLLAMSYDGMLIIAVLIIGGFLFLPVTGGEAAEGPLRLVFQAYMVLLVVGFFGYFWMRGGQTLGLRAWKLCLQRKQGGPLTLGDVVIRLLAGLLTLGPLGLVSVPFHPRGHSLADMLSTTEVVRYRTRDVV